MIPATGSAGMALVAVAAAMREARHAWWIIGSAAVALLGGETTVADIDLLVDARDGDALLARLKVAPLRSDQDARFRSSLFARWAEPALPVEIMADLHVAADGGWRRIALLTRQPVPLEAETVFVPERAEMVDLLHRFGRPKDLQRARLLMPGP